MRIEFRINSCQKLFTIDKIPNECPMCHFKIVPIRLHYNELDAFDFELIFKCPHCKLIFKSLYLDDTYKSSNPTSVKEQEISENLKKISTKFTEIYNQSFASETYNLHQLTGIGLRKSLEYLVKDYLIYKNKQDNEKIKSIPLSQCLTEQYINDAKLIAIAKRCLWLGNDETHYEKKWEDKDINDLKMLLKITMLWIDSQIEADKYIAEMDSPKK